MDMHLNVNPTAIDNKIEQIELLCDHILELKNKLTDISDNYSEGMYYTKYMEGISVIQDIMNTSVNVICGYINFLNYVKENYMTLSGEMADAMKNL